MSSLRSIRLIARLDIKGASLIKGVHLEGLRVIGSPRTYSIKYYEQGADEIIFMDSVASLYGRNHLADAITSAVRDNFIPITVGGGIRSAEDAKLILRAGADKVALNTGAIANPNVISSIAKLFGSQCVVLSIEAKQVRDGQWEAYTENGRERTRRDVVDWALEAVSLGAGEILLTSIDREGTRKGFDVHLVKAVSTVVSVPVIASGGMGKPEDLIAVVKEGGADAVAMADMLHYGRGTIQDVRKIAIDAGIRVRRIPDGRCNHN